MLEVGNILYVDSGHHDPCVYKIDKLYFVNNKPHFICSLFHKSGINDCINYNTKAIVLEYYLENYTDPDVESNYECKLLTESELAKFFLLER